MTARKVITTPTAPAAIGPYAQAIMSGPFIFVAGQIPLDPNTMEIVAGGISKQTDRVIRNIAAILESSASSLSEIVRCVVYLTTMEHFSAMNEVYEAYFPNAPHARSTVGVKELPRGALIEIEATCIRSHE